MNPTRRARLLQEWRILPEPPPRPDRMQTIEEVIQKVLPRLGLEERLSENQIQAAWESLVGDFVATHSTPVTLKEGCLTIRVTNPVIRYELETAWKKRILTNLKAAFPTAKLRTVRFQT